MDNPDLRVVPVAESGRNPADDEGDTESLSPRETRFADALASGSTPADAAKAIRLSERSGRRWRKRPEIVEAIRARLSENIAVGKSILAAGMAKAARNLVDMASGEVEADAATVSACRAVTDGAIKMVELSDLQQQLAELEARLPKGN